GVRFTNGYVSGPYCSPTRAGLMTGRYQQRFGHEFNPSGHDGLPTAEMTLADRLKVAGYATGLVGKWHLGGQPEMHPLRRGFDEFFGFLGGSHDYFRPAGILRGTEAVAELEYTTDDFGREAVDFIERHRDRPWFLYLSFNAVHTPMQATDERLARFAGTTDARRRTYNAMMLAMDEAIGRVRSTLVEAGLEQHTLVVFLSDNGGPTMRGTTINGARNTPLRGAKRTTLEGGIRVPFVISWPGRIAPGVFERPVIQLDAHVTALAAAGIALPPDGQLDGVDLFPYLAGQKAEAPHDALYWRLGEQMAVRVGDYKLVRYDGNADAVGDEPAEALIGPRLYNLADDVGETHDLAAAMPEKMNELQAKWDAWNATLVPPLWGGGKAAADRGKSAESKKKARRR
ncbi:MAG: sulfatase-like hydrolase/transferase, partial [Pirellulaceae bacterium]|nr:sulfatase-like hydrolase/transferase [Pirellulaceae bacterium]